MTRIHLILVGNGNSDWENRKCDRMAHSRNIISRGLTSDTNTPKTTVEKRRPLRSSSSESLDGGSVQIVYEQPLSVRINQYREERWQRSLVSPRAVSRCASHPPTRTRKQNPCFWLTNNRLTGRRARRKWPWNSLPKSSPTWIESTPLWLNIRLLHNMVGIHWTVSLYLIKSCGCVRIFFATRPSTVATRMEFSFRTRTRKFRRAWPVFQQTTKQILEDDPNIKKLVYFGLRQQRGNDDGRHGHCSDLVVVPRRTITSVPPSSVSVESKSLSSRMFFWFRMQYSHWKIYFLCLFRNLQETWIRNGCPQSVVFHSGLHPDWCRHDPCWWIQVSGWFGWFLISRLHVIQVHGFGKQGRHTMAHVLGRLFFLFYFRKFVWLFGCIGSVLLLSEVRVHHLDVLSCYHGSQDGVWTGIAAYFSAIHWGRIGVVDDQESGVIILRGFPCPRWSLRYRRRSIEKFHVLCSSKLGV